MYKPERSRAPWHCPGARCHKHIRPPAGAASRPSNSKCTHTHAWAAALDKSPPDIRCDALGTRRNPLFPAPTCPSLPHTVGIWRSSSAMCAAAEREVRPTAPTQTQHLTARPQSIPVSPQATWARRGRSPSPSAQVHQPRDAHTHKYPRTHARVYAHKHKAHKHTSTQAHKHTGTQAHRHTGTQAHRYTGTQAHRHTGTQAHRHTGTQHATATGTHVQLIGLVATPPSRHA